MRHCVRGERRECDFGIGRTCSRVIGAAPRLYRREWDRRHDVDNPKLRTVLDRQLGCAAHRRSAVVREVGEHENGFDAARGAHETLVRRQMFLMLVILHACPSLER